jgi:3-hydroxyisobutyrate dehydrogenase-like beta-hydroxyacid dehydrogenase
MQINHLGMVGYGEVGKIITAGLKSQMHSVHAWDLKFVDDKVKSTELAHAATAGVTACDGMQALCQASNFIVSAVTASQTLAVAQAAAQHIQAGSVFLDLNSASPGTKQQAAKLIEAAGAHYVEAGVMTSIPPYGIRVPMLLGGSQAAEIAPRLIALGMDAKAVSTDIGIASAIKMCRSVMIKGLEALVIESYATARKYGVEDHVIPTLAANRCLLLQPRCATRQTPCRRNARIREYRQRSRLHPLHGRRHRPKARLGGRLGARRCV